MFYIIKADGNRDKATVYRNNDILEFLLLDKKEMRFTGRLKHVDDFGQVVLEDLCHIGIDGSREYLGGMLRLGVHSMKGISGDEEFNLAIIDQNVLNRIVIARKSGKADVVLERGKKVRLGIRKETSSVICSGTYQGLSDDNELLLKNVKYTEILDIGAENSLKIKEFRVKLNKKKVKYMKGKVIYDLCVDYSY